MEEKKIENATASVEMEGIKLDKSALQLIEESLKNDKSDKSFLYEVVNFFEKEKNNGKQK